MNKIPMEEVVTESNFDEAAYLASNKDVAAAVAGGAFDSGKTHFEKFGKFESRTVRIADERIQRARAAKLQKLKPHLREDMEYTDKGGKLDFLSDELRQATRIVDTNNVSSNGYDRDTLDLIERHSSGLVLDCGCGRRQNYHHNVVNYEIVDYDTTDVLGVGEKLPFKDNTFDAVISIAVLEHVRDPFICAKEISRVLKPGGEIYCSVPFLQPYHGYPHHYFNATHQGIQRLFEDDLTLKRISVPSVGHPAYALHWFLSSWLRGLPAAHRDNFTKMSIGEAINMGPTGLSSSNVGRLSVDAERELACSFVLKAQKPAG